MNGLTQQVKAFERLTIEAAVHGCRESALLALVTNPLVGNVTDAQALLDEVLTINRQWLTQFNPTAISLGSTPCRIQAGLNVTSCRRR